MRIAIALALAGCGRIGFDVGPPGSGDGAPFVDVDTDGVDDGIDNCVGLANPSQADEDADDRGDACDPCPIAADGATLDDPDNDMVTGICDPHPTFGGDEIVLFEGFTVAPTAPLVEGDWSFANGAASVKTSLDALAALTIPIPASTTSETVFTNVRIDELFGNLTPRPVGVGHQIDLSTGNGIDCVFGIDPSNNEIFTIANNRTSTALTAESAAANTGDATTFVSSRDGTEYHCEGSAAAMPLDTSSNSTAPVNRVGLFTRSVSATFDYLLIVTSP